MDNYSVLFSIKVGGPSQNYLILSKAIESIFFQKFIQKISRY